MPADTYPSGGDGYSGGGGTDWSAGDASGASQYNDPVGGSPGSLHLHILTRRVADTLSLSFLFLLALAGYQDDFRESPEDYSQGCTCFLLLRSKHEPDDPSRRSRAATLRTATLRAAAGLQRAVSRALRGLRATCCSGRLRPVRRAQRSGPR